MKYTILVVDDEISVCEVLSKLLKSEGYYVETALSAEKALEKLKEVAFDLIISDIKMPGMNGFELLKRIKTMNINSAVIFITGFGSVSSAVEAIKLGASDYIEKPFKLKQLRNLIPQVLQKHRFQESIKKDKLLGYTLSYANFENEQE